MADVQSYASLLRTSVNFTCRMYLSKFPEAVICKLTLDTTPTVYPVKALAVSTASGDPDDIQADMEIEVRSSGGVYKGRLRVAYGGYNTGTLQVNEVSKARIDLAAGDILDVLRSWRVRDKLVADNEQFDRDSRETYNDQTDEYAPAVASGGPAVGFVDPGTGELSASFDGSKSRAIDPEGSGDLNHDWQFGSGADPSSSTSTSVAFVGFEPGSRWIDHTVTHVANSKTYTQHVPVMAHERTGVNAPFSVSHVTLNANLSGGWDVEITFYEPVSQADLPDGAGIVLWVEEWIGSARLSLGANVATKSTIKFVGYLVSDSEEHDAGDNSRRLMVRAVSPMGILPLLPGFPTVATRVADPDNWLEYKGLTINLLFHEALRQFTTFKRVHDVVVSMEDYAYPELFLQQKTPMGQLLELAEASDGIVTSDRLGRLLAYNDPVLRDSTERNAMITTYILTADDVMRWERTREHRLKISTLRWRGLTAGATLDNVRAIWAKSDAAPDEAAGEELQEQRITSPNPAALYERVGRAKAKYNATFNNLPAGQYDVTLPPQYGFFDLDKEWVGIDDALLAGLRDIDVQSERFRIVSINEEFDAEIGSRLPLRLTVQAETDGAAGVEDVIPVNPLPPTDPPTDPPTFPPNPVPPETGALPIKIFACGYDGKIGRALSFDPVANTVNWDDITGSVTGTPMWACADPFNYFRRFVITSDGLWRCDDIWASSPVWTLVATPAQMFGGNASGVGHKVVMSHLRQGWIAVCTGSYALAISFNYGATWTFVDVRGMTPSAGTTTALTSGHTYINLEVSGHNPRLWVTHALAPNNDALRYSDDWGLTWSSATQIYSGARYEGCFHVPYKRLDGANNVADGSQQMWWWHATAERRFYRSDDAGATFVAYWDPGGTQPRPSAMPSLRGAMSYTHDANKLFAPFRSTTTNALYKSTDGGMNWSAMATIEAASHIWNVNGWSMNPDCCIIWSPGTGLTYGSGVGRLKYTLDGGATLIGAPPAFFSSGRTTYAEFDLSDFITARG